VKRVECQDESKVVDVGLMFTVRKKAGALNTRRLLKKFGMIRLFGNDFQDTCKEHS